MGFGTKSRRISVAKTAGKMPSLVLALRNIYLGTDMIYTRISALVSLEKNRTKIKILEVCFLNFFPSMSLLGMFQLQCSVCPGKGRVVVMYLSSLSDYDGALEDRLSRSSMPYQVWFWWCSASPDTFPYRLMHFQKMQPSDFGNRNCLCLLFSKTICCLWGGCQGIVGGHGELCLGPSCMGL